MTLFQQRFVTTPNRLPKDGQAYEYGCILPADQADDFFTDLLQTINWQSDRALIYGKSITTKRKVAWHADQSFSYTYSGTTKKALPWTPTLARIKTIIQDTTGATYNACLLNLYHNGQEGMAWHSDDEKELVDNAPIASLSLGATRRFLFKHKQTQEKTALLLEHGSLVVMTGQTQKHWRHCLPPTKKTMEPRINLTFRSMRTEPIV